MFILLRLAECSPVPDASLHLEIDVPGIGNQGADLKAIVVPGMVAKKSEKRQGHVRNGPVVGMDRVEPAEVQQLPAYLELEVGGQIEKRDVPLFDLGMSVDCPAILRVLADSADEIGSNPRPEVALDGEFGVLEHDFLIEGIGFRVGKQAFHVHHKANVRVHQPAVGPDGYRFVPWRLGFLEPFHSARQPLDILSPLQFNHFVVKGLNLFLLFFDGCFQGFLLGYSLFQCPDSRLVGSLHLLEFPLEVLKFLLQVRALLRRTAAGEHRQDEQSPKAQEEVTIGEKHGILHSLSPDRFLFGPRGMAAHLRFEAASVKRGQRDCLNSNRKGESVWRVARLGG